MRIISVLLLCTMLQGCWFFMVPIPSSSQGNACTDEANAVVGQKVKHDNGKMATVEKVIGRHQRCPTGQRPILVELAY